MFIRNPSRSVLICAVFSVITLTFTGAVSQLLQSPCPNTVQYQFDERGELYASVEVDPPNGNVIQLNVELSVGNRVEGYNGNIQLADYKEKVIEDITNHRPVLYRVYFPRWQGIPPKVTKIYVNGDLICSGPKIPINLVPVLTTINLQYTLRVDVQSLSASVPSDSFTPFQNNEYPYRRPGSQNSRPASNDRRPATNYAPDFGNNQFHFNPSPPEGDRRQPPWDDQRQRPSASNEDKRHNNFNFNPQPPTNDANVFSGNPFFTNLASTSRPEDLFPVDGQVPGNNPQRPNQALDRQTTERIVNIRPTFPKKRPTIPQTPTIPNPVDDDNTDFVTVTKDRNSPGGPYESVCGRAIATNSLIINGDSVPRGAFPWLAALFGVKATGLNYMCSASLISDKHVVTAAHCVQTDSKKLKPEDLLIILGKLNLQRWVPSKGEKMIDPESIHVHPDYEQMNSDADIAVLVMSETVQFTKYIRPLCIWTGDSDLTKIVGLEGTVVGWGKDENDVLITAEPKQTNLPVVSQEKCLRSAYQFQYITSNRTFCAGFRNGSGPCNGDSGSGFAIQRAGKWRLRGVVSMSISDTRTRTCDLKNYVVFTDASKFSTWLLSFIK